MTTGGEGGMLCVRDEALWKSLVHNESWERL